MNKNNFLTQQKALQLYFNYCSRTHKDINFNITKALNSLDPKKEYILRRYFGIHCKAIDKNKICDIISVSNIYTEQTIMMESINLIDICEKNMIPEYLTFKQKI